MSQEPRFINGDLLRLRREAQGWLLNDMATRACMSVKQIRQLEDGGISSFYSEAVKATAAKKVGALLGLSTVEIFAHEAASVSAAQADAESLMADVSSDSEVVSGVAKIGSDPDQVVPVDEVLKTTVVNAAESSASGEAPSSKNSLWLIIVLLALALAVGFHFQPKEEAVAEPPPPLQVLPDAVDSASAASATVLSASSAEVVMLHASAASASLSQKSLAVPTASTTRVVPAVGEVSVVKTSSSSQVVTLPVVSSASKAP